MQHVELGDGRGGRDMVGAQHGKVGNQLGMREFGWVIGQRDHAGVGKSVSNSRQGRLGAQQRAAHKQAKPKVTVAGLFDSLDKRLVAAVIDRVLRRHPGTDFDLGFRADTASHDGRRNIHGHECQFEHPPIPPPLWLCSVVRNGMLGVMGPISQRAAHTDLPPTNCGRPSIAL
jgi:hypothetical protein